MKTATVTAMAKKYWKEVKNRPKPEIFALCEELYRSGYLEESFIVSEWAHALSGRYEREDFAVFQRWIDTYITNWASCFSPLPGTSRSAFRLIRCSATTATTTRLRCTKGP